MKKAFTVEILDKLIEKGWIFTTYTLVVRDPVGRLNKGNKFLIEVSREQYYTMDIGERVRPYFISENEGKTWRVSQVQL